MHTALMHVCRIQRLQLSCAVLRCHGGHWLVGVLLSLALAGPACADGPALSQQAVNQLQALQQQLASGHNDAVLTTGVQRAARLDSIGAEGWTQSLYLQLAATAAARQGDDARAADLLTQARDNKVAPYRERLKWLGQEAGLRARAGQYDQASRLYQRWAGQDSLPASALWNAARVDAERADWSSARNWVDRARRESDTLSEQQRALAANVYQHSGDNASAAALFEAHLDEGPDAWRQAAALYQRSGQPGRAAAIWEAGWQRGILKGPEALVQRIRLHMAGGTPARASEILAEALSSQTLKDSNTHRRLLAQAWTQARARDKALKAWRELANRTHTADDWQELGELAYGWGRWQAACDALRQAIDASTNPPARLWLLQGVAAYELDRTGLARRAFEHARNSADLADQAQQWLKVVGSDDAAASPATGTSEASAAEAG